MDITLLEALLDDLAHAGRTALRLQQDGPLTLPVKDHFDNPMAQALTIADPVLQAFLEARWARPGLRLDLEEEPYRVFPDAPEGPEGTLWVDPIDGTRYYADGLPIFGLCVGWSRQGRLQGAIYAVPSRHVAFVAARGAGAHVIGLPGSERAGQRAPVTLADAPRVMWGRIPTAARQALAARDVRVIDPVEDYDASVGIAAWQVLDGKLGGIVATRGAHARDGASVALLAQEAGAAVLTFDGAPWDGRIGPTGRTEPLVVGVTEAWATSLLALAAPA